MWSKDTSDEQIPEIGLIWDLIQKEGLPLCLYKVKKVQVNLYTEQK